MSTSNLNPKVTADNIQDYFTYHGSLTTPMCHESVCWIIFRQRIGLSKYQVNMNRKCLQSL